MILSHKYKFVCLNPPKTGSGFRERTLKEYADLSIKTNKTLKLRHWNSSEASNYIKSINKNPNDYYWFTFVRNPLERIVSWINMRQNNALRSITIDVKEFTEECLMKNPLKNYIYRDGKLLDFIGSLENITEDLNFVLNKLNIDLEVTEKKAKKDTYKKQYKEKIRDRISREVIEMIADAEKEIIKMKGYKIE